MVYGDGRDPAIAMSRTYLLEVHRGADQDDERLFYELFPVSSAGGFLPYGSGKYDEGLTPAVAINDERVTFEVHKGSERLWYNVGFIDGNEVVLYLKDDFADGSG